MKKQVNDWFLVWIDAGGYHACPWDSKKAKRKVVKHVCGLNCMQKIQAQYTEGVMGMKTVDESVANIEKLTYPEVAQG